MDAGARAQEEEAQGRAHVPLVFPEAGGPCIEDINKVQVGQVEEGILGGCFGDFGVAGVLWGLWLGSGGVQDGPL